jgi:hypothetical protein
LIVLENTDIWRDQNGEISFMEALSTKYGTKMNKQQNYIFHFDNELSIPQLAMCIAKPSGTGFNSYSDKPPL